MSKLTVAEAQLRQYYYDLVAQYTWELFLAGECYLTLPLDFLRVETEHGIYTQVQFQGMHTKSPAPFIRKAEHRAALKVFIPADAIAGDPIYIHRMSRSGLSYTAKLVDFIEQCAIRSCDAVATEYISEFTSEHNTAEHKKGLFSALIGITAALYKSRVAKYRAARAAAGISQGVPLAQSTH